MQRLSLNKLIVLTLVLSAAALQAQQFTLQPMTGQNFRYKDILSQDYSNTYIAGFDYANSSVVVTLDAPGKRFLSGRIVASGLKPNFAYQIKLEGVPTSVNPNGDNATNERLGYIGRWWRLSPPPEWNATDAEYVANKDTAGYVFNGYLLMDFFVTDENGSADYTFKGDNSFHVLWRTNQRARQTNDGPARTVNIVPTTAPAYSVSLGARSTDLYAEYEPTRALPGTLQMPTGHYRCNFGLTEESFHESGTNAGFWAWAFKTLVDFDIQSAPTVTWANPDGIISGTPLSAAQLNASAEIPGTYLYDPPAGTVLQVGSHSLKVTFTPDNSEYSSVEKTVTIAVAASNSAPVINSGITATPNPAVAGAPVLLTAAATDADGNELTYSWNFGDGASSMDSAVTHTFNSGGTFNVQLTVSDGFGGTATAQLSLLVIDTDFDNDGIPDIFDSDGDNDGFSNSIEQLFGTNPYDANDMPAIGPGGPAPLQFTVSKLSVALNFSAETSDSISISGLLPAASNTSINQPIGLDVGGISRLFVVDAKGRGTFETDSLRAKLLRDKKQNTTFVKFQARLKHGRFRASLADEGLTGGSAVKKESHSVVVNIIFDSKAFRAMPVVIYSAVPNRSGRASLLKTARK